MAILKTKLCNIYNQYKKKNINKINITTRVLIHWINPITIIDKNILHIL